MSMEDSFCKVLSFTFIVLKIEGSSEHSQMEQFHTFVYKYMAW